MENKVQSELTAQAYILSNIRQAVELRNQISNVQVYKIYNKIDSYIEHLVNMLPKAEDND